MKQFLSVLILLMLSAWFSGELRAAEVRKFGIAEVNGTKLYYEVAGKGPTVVFIHGGLVDSRLWYDQFDFFARASATTSTWKSRRNLIGL